MRTTFTKEEFVKAVKNNITIADTLRNIGLIPAGENYRTVHKFIRKYNLDTSHWLGRAHLKGKKRNLPKKPLSEILVKDSEYSRFYLKKRLIDNGMLKKKCQLCGCGDEWNGKELVLIIDHINGVNNDNRIENLRLICPNCNSQLKTFCGRNTNRKKKKFYCKKCGKEVCYGKEKCTKCAMFEQRKVERPSYEQLIKDISEMSMVKVGKKYGVSGNAVKKWIKSYEKT